MNVWGNGAFALHLKEAIELNTERMPMYAKLTRGESIPLSKKLIRYEKLSLPFAALADRYALRFQSKGVKIVESEFVPMSLTPPFSEHYPFTPEPLHAFKRSDGKKLAGLISEAKKSGGFEEVSRVAQAELERLHEPRAYHCMLRHLIESILRIANLAPLHIEYAEKVGAPSPEGFSAYLLWSHLPLLSAGSDFDAAAAKIQSEGVPFLYQDVPPIAPTEKLYL
ncbi:MAG: hypothetical protein WCK82_15695 [Bacteroidota bacterium]